MSARILAVANRKGGTAKTTTVVNLAAALAARGLRVLLVDLDTQGHTGLGFGVRAASGEPTVHDLYRGTGAVDLRDAIRVTNVPQIDILPADRGFSGPDGAVAPLGLATALKPLAASYAITLIDTAPTADALLINALASAHHVLVPTQLHHPPSMGSVSSPARIFTSPRRSIRICAVFRSCRSRSICGSRCSGRLCSGSRTGLAANACCRAFARTLHSRRHLGAKRRSNTSSPGHGRFRIMTCYAVTSWRKSLRSKITYCWQS